MNIVLTRAGQRDLVEIYAFVAADSPTAAGRVLDHLFSLIVHLASGELKGPEVQLSDGRKVSRWSAPPYRVYYGRSSRRMVVVRVYHQARRSLERPKK